MSSLKKSPVEGAQQIRRRYERPMVVSQSVVDSATLLMVTPPGRCCDTGDVPPCVFPDIPAC